MGLITVGIADCQASNRESDILVTHGLGSCIAVAIHDATARVAGLLHFMLPESSMNRAKAAEQPFLFADTGIPALFHMAYAKGAGKERLTVRLVGGAQVLDPDGLFNIGKRNHLACRKVLSAAGVMVHAEEVGGTVSRMVRLEVGTGALHWTSDGSSARELRVGGVSACGSAC